MQLAVVISTLLLLAAAEASPDAPAGAAAWRAAGVAVLLAANWAAAQFSASRLRRQLLRRPDRADLWGRRYVWLRRVHLALLIGSLAWIAYGLGWPQIVRRDWALAEVPLIDDLLILAPLVTGLLAFWAACYSFEESVARLAAIRRGQPLPALPLPQHVALQCQQQLGLVLVPLLAALAVQDVARWLAPAIHEQYSWCLHLALLALLVLLMPWWLRRLWRAVPLTGPLRERLQAAAARAGLRLRDILVWQTSGQIANAAVAGLAPPLRYVFLSDRLLQLLSDDQVEAVLLHEAAHVRRRHFAVRLLVVLLPLALWLAAAACLPEMGERLTAALARWGVSPFWQAAVLLPLAAALYTALALGWCSRRLEHDADLWAAARCAGGAEPLISALQALAGGSADSARRASWLHPSVDRRIAVLRSARRPAANRGRL